MFWQNKLSQVVLHHKPYQSMYQSQNRGFFKKMTFPRVAAVRSSRWEQQRIGDCYPSHSRV